MTAFARAAVKWLLVFYLATQAFADFDLLVVAANAALASSWQPPLGLNLTNTLAFGGVSVYVVAKEWGRMRQIRYTFSRRSARLLRSEDPAIRERALAFQEALEAHMARLSRRRFPPSFPLQLEDLLSSKGFAFEDADADDDGIIEYVEELSPLEVATNALFSWMRQEALFKQFTLELHLDGERPLVATRSGNPDTDTCVCLADGAGSEAIESLSREAALGIFFESESRLCRDFAAFKRFYEMVDLLDGAEEGRGEGGEGVDYEAVEAKIRQALAVEPEFLTLRLFLGIVWFRDPTKETAAVDRARALLEKVKEDAAAYYVNYRQARRWRLRRRRASAEAPKPEIDRRAYRYARGLCNLFLARIFCQYAHRFGAYHDAPEAFLRHHRENLKRIAQAAADLRRSTGSGGRRIPLAYRIRAFALHCHDFFDEEEIFYRGRRGPFRFGRLSDTGRDLKRAVAIYSKGLRSCGGLEGASPEFARHHMDALANQRGFCHLYFCLIEGRRRRVALKTMPAFLWAEGDLLWSALCGPGRKKYALANLAILYGMSGDFERARLAGAASQMERIGDVLPALDDESRPSLGHGGHLNRAEAQRLREAFEGSLVRAKLALPALERPFDPAWSYVEGLNELSYAYVFEGLSRGLRDGLDAGARERMAVGLRLHVRALEVLGRNEVAARASPRAASRRLRNLMANFRRAHWHFDDREALPERRDDPFGALHTALGERLASLPVAIEPFGQAAVEGRIRQWRAEALVAYETALGEGLELPGSPF